MPRSVATAISNSFIKGLVTEANALQYPENSCVETFDCIFDFLGGVQRRPGFDYEFGYTQKLIDKTACAINTYHWKNVTGDGTISFLVVQVGATLYFYSSTDGATSLSGNIAAATINLNTYQAAGSPSPYQYECQFSDGLSKLYVVHPCLDNFYVTYSAGVFSATAYTLKIRDLEGVNDTLAVDSHPGVLGANDLHRYNLYNQGWPVNNSYINTFFAAQAFYPSNAEVWWVFKDLANTFNPAVTYNTNSRGNAQAPKGHFILPLYTGDRATASGLSGINSTTSGSARTSSTAFFSGRVWYSGIQAAGFNSKIYFTQIITRDEQVGFCYQSADPTNETLFDLLPDDGGVISIPEAGTIYKMVPTANSLIVFAYRGVWLISGSTGLGFKATDYVVSKISSVRTVSATSFVDVNGMPMWWNTDGVWAVTPTQDGSGLQVQSASFDTIQTFFDDIPTTSKLYARGTYNPLTRVVSWLYRSTDGATIEENYEFDAVLNFNVQTKAFYPWTISSALTVHGINVLDGTGGTSVEETVIDTAVETVVDDAGDIITAFELTNLSVAPKTKYLCSLEFGLTDKFTFAETTDMSFEDWATSGTPQSYESYFITGYRMHGQANKNYQTNYVNLYNEGTGVAYLQGIWDFSVSTGTGRYTSKQLCTWDDDNYSRAYKRRKIRGQGKSLQLKVSSYPAQDFNIIGWSAWETGNQTP
jgi:hypothetical protein